MSNLFFTGLLFLLMVFLRFFKVTDNFTFDIDTQYQTLLAKTIIDHFHVIWIGVSASNIGYYLGPGLVYLTAFLLWLTHDDPVSLAYFSFFVGMITVTSIYIIGNDLFNKRVAVIAMIMYGFSSFIINYDHRYWPIFVPLVSLWIYYSLIKSQKNSHWLVLSVILISLSYHIHLSLLIFWPFIIWEVFKKRKKIVLSTWFMMIGSYFIITLPLLVFDFVHKFDNMLMPLRFISGMLKKSALTGQLHFNLLLSALNKIIFYNSQNHPYLTYVLTAGYAILAVSILRMKRSYPSVLLMLITVVYMFLFGLYSGPIQEYYVVFLFPFIALLTGIALSKVPSFITVPLVILFIAVNGLFTLHFRNDRGLTAKKMLIKKATAHLDKDYYLSYESAMDYEGWRYLFEVYGWKKPAQSKADAMFGWIYPKDIAKTKPPLTVNLSNDFKVTIW